MMKLLIKIKTGAPWLVSLGLALMLVFGCSLQTKAQVNLDPNGISSLYWPFTTGSYAGDNIEFSQCDGWGITGENGLGYHGGGNHVAGDYYSEDWALCGGNAANSCGEVINSPMSGEVIFAGFQNEDFGGQVIIKKENFALRIAHLDTVSVSNGANVIEGTKIGYVGDEGTTNCHAHITLYKNIGSPGYNGHLTGLSLLQGGYSLTATGFSDVIKQSYKDTFAANFDFTADILASEPVPNVCNVHPNIQYAFATANSIKLKWGSISDASSYSVSIGELGFYQSGITGTELTVVNGNLQPATTYSVVVCLDCNNEQPYCTGGQVTTGSTDTGNCPPSSISVNAEHTAITISGLSPSNGYIARYTESGTSNWRDTDITDFNVTSNSIIVDNLTGGASYDLEVLRQCGGNTWSLATVVNNIQLVSAGELPVNVVGITCGVVEASGTITVNDLIVEGCEVTCAASQEVIFSTGFEVQSGGVCNAYINDMPSGSGNQRMATADVENDSEAKNTFTVYPNPHQGQFTLQFGEGMDEEGTLKIFDPQGRLFFLQNNVSTGQPISLNLSGSGKGMYFIYFITKSGTEVRQVVYE
ncbi:peptidoglycan DD-metalloendopeptidase family protein [Fulvivirga sp. 29W222]|uniref:Peptidoglycan DD-metalloendopeptidase family protein n=1 Tax=Fulvivirga marina TaxID=2494733 RepID=A0A937FVY2_9BACT|nr:peptidoglycan DD-metalloendopeptidase family protein [Fulvivirga marina]MBL6445993.1 peptidoglycan DD-metalloendopeptidase family protein [Fulvivirga marina]